MLSPSAALYIYENETFYYYYYYLILYKQPWPLTQPSAVAEQVKRVRWTALLAEMLSQFHAISSSPVHFQSFSHDTSSLHRLCTRADMALVILAPNPNPNPLFPSCNPHYPEMEGAVWERYLNWKVSRADHSRKM